VKSLTLFLLGSIAVANLVRTIAVIQWKEIGKDTAMILRGEGSDAQTIANRQYQPIREVLAELNIHDKIGYITDLRPGEEFTEEYYLTQYALVPIIVDRASDGLLYVVGNFHHPETDLRSIPGLEPLVIAGGRVLFRRRTP
jgi:hypothetical protein